MHSLILIFKKINNKNSNIIEKLIFFFTGQIIYRFFSTIIQRNIIIY